MEDFMFKINYNNCITNVACSILKYFNCKYYHNTNSNLDEILQKKSPKNVVLVLFDGLGSRLLDKVLNKDSFLIKHRIQEISSVFPSTTASSTLSIQTGLNPCEHGWLGWTNFISPLNAIIQLFWGTERGKRFYEKSDIFNEIKKLYLSPKTLVEIIKEKNNDTYFVSPYGDYKYQTLNSMLEIIESKINIKTDKKKFFYVYNKEPDSTLHKLGCGANEVNDLILERNSKLEEFYNNKMDNDTLMIILSDHGHIDGDSIHLTDYKDILELMETDTFGEDRCPMFKIKEGVKAKFKKLFEKYFGDFFILLSKDEIKDKKIFGDIGYEENPLFDSSLGDFIAINKGNNNKVIYGENGFEPFSVHGGLSDDEIYIPLIVLSKSP